MVPRFATQGLLAVVLASVSAAQSVLQVGPARPFVTIQAAVQALKDVPFDGLVRTSEQIYDLLASPELRMHVSTMARWLAGV